MRKLLVVVLLALVAVSGATYAQALVDTLISYHIGCSGITYTFSTIDEDVYEAHHHVIDVEEDYDLTDDTEWHYVDVDGDGTHTIFVGFEYSLPEGSEVEIETFHLHSDNQNFDHEELLSGTYTCSDAVEAATGPVCTLDIPAGAVVGDAPFASQIYWAPGKASPGLTINPGTYLVLGQDESETYYQIVLACQKVWVLKAEMQPSYTPPQNGTPLPTQIVS